MYLAWGEDTLEAGGGITLIMTLMRNARSGRSGAELHLLQAEARRGGRNLRREREVISL